MQDMNIERDSITFSSWETCGEVDVLACRQKKIVPYVRSFLSQIELFK